MHSVVHVCQNMVYNPEYRLLNHLFQNYSTNARPVSNVQDVVTVYAGISLSQILSLDETTQVLYTIGWINMLWIDQSLKWNASQFDGVSSILVDYDKAWRPDLAIYNTADELFPDSYLKPSKLRVYDTGHVYFSPGGVFATSCPMNVTYYPYDTQKCVIILSEWMAFSTEVKLEPFHTLFNVNYTFPNGEWIISGTKVEKQPFTMESARPGDREKDADSLNFILYLKRNPDYITQNIIFPAYLTSGLSIVTFLIPPSSGERVSVSLSVLVAFTVFMLITFQSIPRTSTLPLLTIYLALQLTHIAFTVVFSAVVVNLYNRKVRKMNWFFARFISVHDRNYCRERIRPNGVSDMLENKRQTDGCSWKVVKKDGKKTNNAVDIKDTDECQWQTIAMILNWYFLVFYLISNLITFLYFWVKVEDHL